MLPAFHKVKLSGADVFIIILFEKKHPVLEKTQLSNW